MLAETLKHTHMTLVPRRNVSICSKYEKHYKNQLRSRSDGLKPRADATTAGEYFAPHKAILKPRRSFT